MEFQKYNEETVNSRYICHQRIYICEYKYEVFVLYCYCETFEYE